MSDLDRLTLDKIDTIEDRGVRILLACKIIRRELQAIRRDLSKGTRGA